MNKQLEIYSIPQLVKQLINTKSNLDENYENYLLEFLIEIYKESGDQGVIENYQIISGVQIESIIHGRYVFAKLYNPNLLCR